MAHNGLSGIAIISLLSLIVGCTADDVTDTTSTPPQAEDNGVTTTAATSDTTAEPSDDPALAEPLVILTNLFPTSLNPILTNATASNIPIYDYWIGLDTEGNLVPEYGVVENWSIEHADTESIYTFQIRTGVTFHDGVEVTGEDLKFSLEYFTRDDSVSSGSSKLRGLIGEITVVDPQTVEVRTTRPYGGLLNDLSHRTFAEGSVLPKHYIEEVGTEGFAENPIGTGVCQYESQSEGVYSFVARDGAHWLYDELTHDCFTLLNVNETSTALAMIRANEADVTSVPYDQAESLEGEGYRIIRRPGAVAELRFGNMFEEGTYLSDLRVRQALNMAVDRQAILDNLYLGFGVPSGTPHFGQFLADFFGEDYPVPPYDPDAARALMEGAVNDNGWSQVELTFNSYPGTLGFDVTNEAIASTWESVFGDLISVEVRPIDAAANRELAVNRDLANTVIGAPGSDSGDWTGSWLSLQHSDGTLSGYALGDPTLDGLIETTAAAIEDDQIAEAYDETVRYMQDQVTGISVAFLDLLFVVNPERVGDDWSLLPITTWYNYLDLIVADGANRPMP